MSPPAVPPRRSAAARFLPQPPGTAGLCLRAGLPQDPPSLLVGRQPPGTPHPAGTRHGHPKPSAAALGRGEEGRKLGDTIPVRDAVLPLCSISDLPQPPGVQEMPRKISGVSSPGLAAPRGQQGAGWSSLLPGGALPQDC